MKIKQLLCIVVLGTLVSWNSVSADSSFTIQGKINQESGTIYLQSFRNKMFFIVDSTEIKNGYFSFQGSLTHPDLYGLTLNRNESFSPYFIFLENNPIEVVIDTDDRRNITVNGSYSQDLFTSYIKADKKSFDLEAFLEANPASIVSAYIVYRDYSYRFNQEQITSALNKLDSSLDNTEYVQELKKLKLTLERLTPGNPAPDFTSVTPDEETIRFSDYTGKGYLLLDFWASWCGPCRRENPNLVAAYNKYHELGFDIFAVSLDKDGKAWRNGIEKDGLVWTQVSDLKFWDSEPAQIYGVRAIPTNFLIGPDGKIVARNLTGEALQKKLEEIYNQ